jgi:hypothetical protein
MGCSIHLDRAHLAHITLFHVMDDRHLQCRQWQACAQFEKELPFGFWALYIMQIDDVSRMSDGGPCESRSGQVSVKKVTAGNARHARMDYVQHCQR